MQHGLNPSNPSDRKTIDGLRSWYYRRCGSETPRRQHWRKLIRLLLEEAEAAVNRLAICIEQLSSAALRSVVESQVRLHARTLSKEEWRGQVRASVQALAPTLDPDRVVEKHISKLQGGFALLGC
jgi:hypothetical protein